MPRRKRQRRRLGRTHVQRQARRLHRSSHDGGDDRRRDLLQDQRRPAPHAELQEAADRRAALRSEEHTSELQSLAYLVCRLLLEKKKTSKSPQTTNDQITTHTTV